jgi:acid stress chaperone HdeB
MKRILFVSSVIVLLSASSMAPAQDTVDVTKITCDEFVKYEIADPKRIESWISGYYHGTHNNPIIDRHKMLQNMDELEQYCFQNPNALVMKAYGEILGPQ